VTILKSKSKIMIICRNRPRSKSGSLPSQWLRFIFAAITKCCCWIK